VVNFTHRLFTPVDRGLVGPQGCSERFGEDKYLFLNNQPGTLIIPILFPYKTLHVSGIFSAHHQEFSTVHSALVSFTQVYDDRFQAECLEAECLEAVIKNLHETYQCRMYSRKLLMIGREDPRNM